MKINVFTKEIAITPSICSYKEKFKIVLRYPNQFDLVKILSDNTYSNILNVACELFLRFENKPQLVNEDGREIDYENLSDMLKLGGNEILSVITDVVKGLSDAVKEAGKVEKKF